MDFAGAMQLGFAGFCGILLWMNWRIQERMALRLDEQTASMSTLVADNTKAMIEFSHELRTRPCQATAWKGAEA